MLEKFRRLETSLDEFIKETETKFSTVRDMVIFRIEQWLKGILYYLAALMFMFGYKCFFFILESPFSFYLTTGGEEEAGRVPVSATFFSGTA